MTQHPTQPEPSVDPQTTNGAPPRGGFASPRLDRPLAILAGLVLLGLFVLTVIGQNAAPPPEAEQGSPQLGLRVLELEARYLVGTNEIATASGSSQTETLLANAERMETGSVGQRLRHVAVVLELGGVEPAAAALQRLEVDLETTSHVPTDDEAATQRRLHSLLGSAAGDPSALEQSDREALRSSLGWFGDLILAPRDGDPAARQAVVGPAVRLVWGILTLVTVAAISGLVGFAGLVIVIVLLSTGAMRLGFRPGARRSSVYLETFAAWFVVFMGLSIVGELAFANGTIAAQLGVGMVAMFASLVVLAWPTIRGIPFGEVRDAVGLRAPRGVIMEMLAGAAAYAMSLPVVGVGLMIMLLLMWITGGGGMGTPAAEEPFQSVEIPAHPIIELVASGDFTAKLIAVLLASVAAPIVEEIMFRGVLYRFLRDASTRLGTLVSVLFSGLVGGFIFAAIHPQGWMAIPALMALALGFSMAREWRSSVLPGIVGHAINNSAVTCILLLAFG